MIEWNADPVLIHIGFLQVRWYGLLFMLGFVLGYFIAKWMFRQENRPVDSADRLVVYMFFGTLIGSRLGHCLFYEPEFYLANPLEMLKVWKGGLASHGGVIGIVAAIFIYAKKTPNQPFIWVMDRMSVVAALGASFIRLGNLFNSEILGKGADVPWAFVFTKVDSVPRHPAQLYESVVYMALFIVLALVYRRRPKMMNTGWMSGFLLTGVFTARFFIEWIKENQVPFESAMTINMGQVLSIPMVLFGLLLLWSVRFKPYQAERASRK